MSINNFYNLEDKTTIETYNITSDNHLKYNNIVARYYYLPSEYQTDEDIIEENLDSKNMGPFGDGNDT